MDNPWPQRAFEDPLEKQLKALRDENTVLKRLVADMMEERDMCRCRPRVWDPDKDPHNPLQEK